MFLIDKKTICALASGAGTGAISLIRVSGPDAKKIILEACPGLKKKSIQSHRAYLSKFRDSSGALVDEPLVLYFENNKSYTGEETVEINCHGSPLIAKKIIERLTELGCRSAEPGEFTFRAFMNGKIDLVQAEAVLSVIESQSESALRVSLRQLEGQLSENFKMLESDLVWCLAHIEASIDFSTEGIDVVDNEALVTKLENIKFRFNQMLSSFSGGQVIQNGLKVALVGQPNVGKSSLLNLLVQKEKAIVTPIAGTTRDIVEGTTQYSGLMLHFSDTAGLRETSDVVEKIGVEKSFNEASKSDAVLFVFDLSAGLQDKDIQLLKQIQANELFFVGNKTDLLSPEQVAKAEAATRKKLHEIGWLNQDILALEIHLVSALDLSARDLLLKSLTDKYITKDFLKESVLSSARQAEMTRDALSFVDQVIVELTAGVGSEFIAQTLKSALLAVQKILGEVYDDQIMDRVFKEFCLGK